MADDPHADATPIEVISQNEALQRERSGGFLADGQRAPEAAMVDMQSPPPGGGTAPKQPAAQSQPAAKDDEAFWSQYEKPAGKAPKTKTGAAAKTRDPDDEYWSQYGEPEALPPKAAVPAKKQSGGLWRSAVEHIGNQGYAAAQGLGGATTEAGGALNTIAAPLVQSVETWKDLLSGKIHSLSQDAPTGWQDAWFKNTVDPTIEHAQDFATDESASFAEKASHAVGATLGYLSQAILTGGAGGEVTATTTGAELAAHGIKAAQAPAVTQAVNVGREAYQSTGDAELSFKLAATTYSFSVVQNAGPIAMPGKLATRVASGAAITGLGGEAEREATNAIAPEEMQQPFSAEGAVLNLAQGGLMGGIAGPRTMPHQAVEKPQNIMEHAQNVAAAEAKANGGDLLDQTLAATHVNAVLSAHHDAAAYEAHMESQHQRVTDENAIADQQAEQQAREDGLNQAANEKAAPVTPATLFERREQEQAAQKDKDFTAAKNQKGDQEIERGDTLAAGTEKGEEGFEKPKLLDTLSPEQAEAFKSLKERRAASENEPNDVTARLKAQNPEDNFTPYVEPKATENGPKAAEGTAEETPAEGDSWKTPTGATVEVLKDHGDGTYTVRTTPEDSSQLPRRRKVSEAALNLMKSTAEPVKAPQTLGERRAAVGAERQDMAKTSAERAAERERVAALRDREEGVVPKFEPEPIPEQAARSEGEAARRDAEGKGTTRLYRGEAKPGSGKPVADWVKQRQKELGVDQAKGRWFTDRENAEWYKNDAVEGRVTHVDVPSEDIEKYRVSNNAEVSKYSKDPEREFFLPREIADSAREETPASNVDTAAKESAYSPENDKPTPTQAQYEAGNYSKGHVDVQGLPVTIEHPAGTTRPGGAEMGAHYGYVKGTVAADGQHVDIMIGKHPENDTHFIVDHMNGQGYEQAKVLTGFANRLEAMRAYRKAYPDSPMGPVSEVKTPALKEWLKTGDTTKPYDRKGVNRLADARFADAARFRASDVNHTEENGEHTASTPGGMTMADRHPNGNIRVLSSETQPGMRGQGEGTARLERLAQEAHKSGGKLESSHEVSEPEQRVYKSLADRGYDVKTNVHTTDRGTGVKTSTSELKPVYEVGPRTGTPMMRDLHEAPHGRDAADADRRVATRMTREQAVSALKALTDKIGDEGMQVHTNKSTLPDNLQKAMVDNNHPNPRGVYDPSTDTVHIIADAHRSNDELHRTAVHESMHQGIRRLFDSVPDYQKAMSDIYDNIHDRAGAIGSPIKGVNKAPAKTWMKDYMSQHRLDARNARHQQLAADDYIAHLAEHDVNDPQQENPSILRRAIDAIRAGLRKLGAVRKWTDNDIRRLIRESNANLASENAGIRESALAKGLGPRFADEEDTRAESYPADHPLAIAHKFGRTMEDQANYNPGFVRKRMDWMKDKVGDTQDTRLAFIGLRNLKDFMDKSLMPSLHQFIRVHDQMDGRRGQLMNKAADIAKDWSRYVSKDKVRGGALGELMHASTLGGVDPAEPFESRYTAEAKSADPTKQAHDDMRTELHQRLRDVYNKQLDAKGREIFNTVRDHYVLHRQEVFNALQARIDASGADANTKKSLMSELRQKFEAGKVQGPYFPLARFGNHWAFAKDAEGNTVSFSRFESRSKKNAWIDNATKLGYKVEGGQRLDDKSMMERIDPKFVQKVTELVKNVDPALADEVWQEYLKAMPEMSMRKQFIHRIGRLGYTMDALRAFAHNSFHGAHQLARLEYGNRLDNVLDNAKTEAQNMNAANPKSNEASWASALARELGRRYDWIKNPRSSPIASALTQFGFGWYLGAAPATAFRVFSQNPMIAQPVLAGFHGQIGATRELSRASAQWAMSKGSLGDTLRGNERRAFDTADEMGVFSNTATQNLANGGSGKPMFTGAAYHIANVAGFLFNAMEHHNRMTTFLAGYRLGAKSGMDHDTAVTHAVDQTWASHFDYTNANRPRLLQNDFAKVALLFRQYAWGVTYRLAREFRDTINKELPPEERTRAAKTFAGLIGRQLLFSGVTGTPLYWVGRAVVNAVFGDKDQPFDMDAAVHKQLADHLGQTASDAIMTGPVGAISGASLSGGASYGDLWYREPSRELTAPQYATDVLSQIAGPVAAVPLNMATGASMIADGQIERGFEHFVPPEAAGIMKAIRYSKEGVTNLKGEAVLTRDEIDNRDLFLQAINFTPQKVADAYKRNTALKNVSKAIMDRRAEIINHLAVAGSMGDTDEIDTAMEEASHFDEVNPGVAIKGGSIINATRNLLKDQAESINGVKLPPGLGGLYDKYGKSENQ